ncbi:MAG: gamma carbonic anhydrase family protein [Candidatus Krumholzibacteriota bacterium]|nr:gamma carbonic anhydrase family protein [Candidatus Krumholzibacteriota bacterium]
MQIEHRGKRPAIHSSAVVSPTAVVSGDVTVGENTVILHGAVVSAEGGVVAIGANCVIMEHAVIRATRRHPVRIGDNCLLGPNAYVSGATVENNVFLATGCAIFNGARIGARSTVRIHGVVHVNTVLLEGSTVPIGWVAVGDPAGIHSPHEHDAIWAVQEKLDFPGTVWGMARPKPGESNMPEAMRRYTRALRSHGDDVVVE